MQQVQYSLQRGLKAKLQASQLSAALCVPTRPLPPTTHSLTPARPLSFANNAAEGPNVAFPNASYPTWNALALYLGQIADLRGVAWAPYVQPSQIHGFNAYANATLGTQWAGCALALPGGCAAGDMACAAGTIALCGYNSGNFTTDIADFQAGLALTSASVSFGCFAGNSRNRSALSPTAPYYVPVIHEAPLHTNEGVIDYDLNSEPLRAATLAQVYATRQPATTDFIFLKQDLTIGLLNRIASLMLHPVIVNGTLVGVANTVFNWDTVLAEALPSYITGIDAVLSSGLSSRVFSMRLIGGIVEGLGLGDLHQTNPSLAKYTRTATATLGTTWTVTLYPTRELLARYRTTGPRDRCIAVVSVIVVCIALFFVHDWLARSRSTTLARLVQATNRIVKDVFPKNVRARIVSQAMKEGKAEEEALSQGNSNVLGLIQRFVGIENAVARTVARRSSTLTLGDTGPCIADTFPAVTVLFTDVVGFTAWSSSVPPEVVFRVLGALFASFDALAHKLGIFKVCVFAAAHVLSSPPDARAAKRLETATWYAHRALPHRPPDSQH